MEQKRAIISKINRSRKGTIFLPDSFLPIDARQASNILSDLTEEGKLVRVAFGIYVKPKNTRLGNMMPSMYEIAETIAKRDAAQILPAGPTAENFLGFSTQVPMNAVYLTSGTPRKIKIGNRTLTLKHTVPKAFAFKGKTMPILVLALKSIGKDNVTADTIANVYGILKDNPEETTWNKDIKLAPIWIRKIILDTKQRIKNNEQVD